VLNADIHRHLGASGLVRGVRLFLKNRSFRPVATLRWCQATRRCRVAGRILYPVARVLHRWACRRAAMDLSPHTEIGAGLLIAHSWGIVVNEHARLGRNVTLFQGATIGQADRLDAEGRRISLYPVIEDGVWLGPNAVVVGGITIGAGSRIMANSVVTSDVPARSMVAGNPGTIVRSDCNPDMPNPAPTAS
jgi:serine O-acetyltransferase